MLDRSSNAQASVPLHLVASGPISTEVAEGRDPCRVAGEDAPVWLAASFAIIGTMIAVASVSAWQQSALGPSQPLPPSAVSLFERLRQDQDEASASPAPLVRKAQIPSQPQPAPEIPPPPAAATAAAPSLIPDAAPAAVTIGTGTSQLPDRRTAAAECFGPLTIPFARNSAQPNADDVRKSGEPLRRWLSTHSDAVILIEGHSDTTGTEDVNVLLSYSRAKAVAGLLKRAGMPARQMTIRAAGSSAAAGGTTGLASDRSALLRIAGVEDCGGVEAAMKGP
jgi:outer membrane protein OmpA-like peptidoglycan-associated protein